ncbi:beta-ketoacyl synthase N-terminal-like domain-containing protein [Saccharomonospora sp. NPDC046836]|uniref:beta-ketoacyl synthase N-terminal-like domain-containing protein n=1 Tax=Saccharomonospora sp. NPDC046836 TaxID=3156921 RepID=UPI0033DB2204
MPSTRWLMREPNPEAGTRLLCFPYSGAPLTLFADWRIPGVQVLPLLLPGRGPRKHEPLTGSMPVLAERIVDEVVPLLGNRFAFFGHSMGAWLAHAVAALLAERGLAGPERLFVASAPPPHLPPRPFSSLHGLSDDEIVETVIGLGGAPASARDAIHANVEVIRADATAVGEYRPTARRLSCPVSVVAGTGDPLFEVDDLVGWRDVTSGEVSIRLIDGGHFTVAEQRETLLHGITKDLGAATREADPIAVIGIGCRLPGVNNPDEFWTMLSAGRSAVRKVPADRPTDPTRHVMSCGGFVDGVDLFDAEYFGFTPREAQRADPRLRLLLMVAQEALDDANLSAADIAGPRSGIWIGESHSDYWDLSLPTVAANMYTLSGGGLKSFLSGRLSHFFDLQGPSITLDTSCSASLTAVHAACQALRAGEVDVAFAGGAHLILNPDGGPSTGLAKAFSSMGRSAFASAGADGYVRAEGIGVVLLKRLSEAVAAGDPIHAVIEGSAVNANGQSGRNIVATSVPGQIRMMRAALASAGCDPDEVGYVEAHGPGTKVGDAVELTALHEVYGNNEQPCLVGSVKTNIGHLEPGAGIAGFIKTVLALENGLVPASLHADELTPVLDWAASSLRVPAKLEPWPRAGRRRAAVSSFGLSGANAHVVVAAAPQQQGARPRLPQRTWRLNRYWYTEVH